MKNLFSTCLVLILAQLFAGVGFAQNSTPTSQSNTNLNFNNFLAGVRFAEVVTTPQQEQFMIDNPSSGGVYLGVIKYLQEMGFITGFTRKFSNTDFPSLCDKVEVYIKYNISGSRVQDLNITFVSCNGDYWQFVNPRSYSSNTLNIENNTFNAFRAMYGFRKPVFNKNLRYSIPGEKTNWNEVTLKEYFIKNGASALEGVYENSFSSASMAKYKLAVVKIDDKYKVIYISGAPNYDDWREGDLKANLVPTSSHAMFKSEWLMANKEINDEMYVSFESNIMNVLMKDAEKSVYVKMFPSAIDNISVNNNGPSSGTGFAVSSIGLVATNYHVVNGASKIIIKGINGDFTRGYKAKIVGSDKNNDLAILKIEEYDFNGFKDLPYNFSIKPSVVGTSIFVLGYPLRATMGDEIKLTNGIVSSGTGFQGDITAYQVSAPVQPGNSGGPLFNERGELIGIINSRHTGAENASYAIKSMYLSNLLYTVYPDFNPLGNVNNLVSKSLADQVRILKKYTYIIETN